MCHRPTRHTVQKGVGQSVTRQKTLQKFRKDDSERKTQIAHGRGWANWSTPAILWGVVRYNGKKVAIALYLAVFVTRDRGGYDIRCV